MSNLDSLQSEVTRFHVMNEQSAGKRFIVQPQPDQDGRLEFAAYANRVAAALNQYGLRAVQEQSKADIGVRIRFGTGDSFTENRSIPIYAQTGGGPVTYQGQVKTGQEVVSYSGTTYTPPVYNVVGSTPVTQIYFRHFLQVELVDLQASTPEKPVYIFEGKVNGVSSHSTFAHVGSCMIETLFRDFPGPQGGMAKSYQDNITLCGR